MGFLQDITLGQYIYRDSLIHSLDPRVKLLSLICLGIGLIFLKGAFCLSCLSLLLLTIILLADIPFNVVQGFPHLHLVFYHNAYILWMDRIYSSGSVVILLKLKKGFLTGF